MAFASVLSPLLTSVLTFSLSLNMICYVYFDERQKGSLEVNIVLNLILLISQGDNII